MASDQSVSGALRSAYRKLFREGAQLEEALAQLKPAAAEQPDVRRMTDFITASQRSIIR